VSDYTGLRDFSTKREGKRRERENSGERRVEAAAATVLGREGAEE
jgi:hypothetical protein